MKSDEVLNDAYLFEMSNFRKHETGLPINIYVSDGRSFGNKLPRLKMMIDQSDKMDVSNTVSVLIKKNITVDDIIGYAKIPSKIFQDIRDYININYDVLINYWNGDISTTELTQNLKKLNK